MTEPIKILRSNSIYTGISDQPLIDGYILAQGSKILALKEGEIRADDLAKSAKVYDFRGKTISPGLIDSHTHLVHAGSREKELALKLAGASYMEIHKVGGIKSTVAATRAASAQELRLKAQKALENMLRHGTTTVEAKSGYGLDLETELRVLRINRELDKLQPLTVVSTYMGAHDLPKEFDHNEAYIDFMIHEVMPKVKEEGLAEFVDIFCEEGIFSLEDSRKIGEAAKKLGFKLKIHADEIEAMGGAGLAAELGATSSEHLMAIADEDIPRMAASGTVAVVLPATTFFLRAERFAPAKKMRAEGVTVAIASDYNPGSSPCENLQMAMDMACFGMGLEPLEILEGVTINAAKAVNLEDQYGSLEAGKYADFTIFDAINPDYIFYHFGVNNVTDVFKWGEQVLCDRALNTEALDRVLTYKKSH